MIVAEQLIDYVLYNMKNIILQLALTDVCPLDCSYCCMKFVSKENNKPKNNLLLDRIVDLINYLVN